MKTKSFFLAVCGLFYSVQLLFAQDKVQFSHQNSWYENEFFLVLTTEDGSPIYYTKDGLFPQSSSMVDTVSSGDSIFIGSLADSAYHLLSRLGEADIDSNFLGSGGDQIPPSYYFDLLDLPPSSEVPKKTIIRACTGDCEKVYTRSYGVGSYQISGWEVEVIFYDTSQGFNTDSGLYMHGAGIKIPLTPPLSMILGDTFFLQNYNFRNLEYLYGNLADFESYYAWMPEHLKSVDATFLFFYENDFVESIEGSIRPNGNTSIHRGIKPHKVYLEESSKKVHFAETGNFQARTMLLNNIHNQLDNALGNLVSEHSGFSKISKNTDYGMLSFYNGRYLESFGSYWFLSAADNKYAETYLGFNQPSKIRQIPSDIGLGEFVGEDTIAVSASVALIRDTAVLFDQSGAYLDSLMDRTAWIQFLGRLAYTRSTDAWDNNSVACHEGGGRITPFFKDGDSAFNPWHSEDFDTTVFSLDDSLVNLLGFYLSGDTTYAPMLFEAYSGFRFQSLWFTSCSQAAVWHPEDMDYYQNMLIDVQQLSYRLDKSIPVLNEIESQYLANWDVAFPIARLNNVGEDLLWEIERIDQVRFFLENAQNAYFQNWLDVFHPEVSLIDSFKIFAMVDLVEGCEREGHINVNSMSFYENGYRDHFRGVPILIQAVSNPGYEFVSWVEYPDSPSTFMLNHIDSGNVALTAIYQQVENMCSSLGEIVISEVLPWNTNGSDFVELYNPSSSESMSLGGSCITDNKNEPCQYQLPYSDSLVIGPGGYLVLSFDRSGDREDPTVVRSFGLSKNGETFSIYTPDSSLIVSVEWPQLEKNVSYGYCPDVNSTPVLLLGSGPIAMDSITMGYENFCPAEDTTSVQELASSDFKVWPNPTSEILNLQDEVDSYVIYNTWGARIQEGGAGTQINVTSLPQGFYVLEVQKGKERYQVKFIKQ